MTNIDPPIQVHRYDENSFILRQNKCIHYEAPFMYLLFGNDCVMLLDTGATADPIKFPIGDTVRRLISNWATQHNKEHSIPLIICHSHAHNDHAFGDDQFIGQDNVTIVPSNLSGIRHFFGFEHWPKQLSKLELGNRTLNVIPIPGHEGTDIAFYDRRTKLLFTGDTFYPGLLVVRNWEDYRTSIDRLKHFADNHEIAFILGGHIEMKNTPCNWFGYRQLYHPNEHILQLETKHLLELHDTLLNLPNPRIERHRDFIIYPAKLNLPAPPPDVSCN
jgi:glyoxylase-like metal-dependent hydrolase (beta-lactamase superfamily II)